MMKLLAISFLTALTAAQETIYGVYIFHRHGDRTPKSLPPANLTALGYQEILTSGQYYRDRYVSSSASLKLRGLSSDVAIASQMTVTAPSDTVLQDSAIAFLQGLYPPVARSETLRNGTIIQAPMSGYNLIPVGLVSSGTGSEDNGWLQDASGCYNAILSSNNYFLSADYQNHLSSTQQFYQNLVPVINGTFSSAQANFKNAYTIFDLINVAEIHNTTIPSSNLLDNSTLFQLRTLADSHEWGLAYNASDIMRAMPGMQLAGEIVSFLNNSITTKGKSKLGIQFGAYASFLSFFGLADLPAANSDFYGVPDYASSMVFELFLNGSASGGSFPDPKDLQVRFLFHNGTTSNISEPVPYPLFGGSDTAIPWSTFVSKMNNFAVSTTEEWCSKCGNTTGTCAAYAANASSSSTGATSGKVNGHHMSVAIGGVIGAFVTLAVVLGVEALILLLSGLRLAKKSPATQVSNNGDAKGAA